jgi:Putative Ig domain/Fibronectin type III domain
MTSNFRQRLWVVIAFSISTAPTAALAQKTSTTKSWSSSERLRRNNQAPVISGAPATTVAAGAAYSFIPVASDPDGNTLWFTISNRPAWATFNGATGRLQGTPQIGNAGTYGNIVISVSDGRKTASLAPFGIVVTAPTSPTAPTTNAAPTISGAPATAVIQGTQYAFQPTAKDVNGDPLTFGVTNKPAWATFAASTGRLQGTPGAGDVGMTSGIVITVSDGNASAALPAFSVTVQATAIGSATLNWLPPTQNVDGSPLTNLAGYKVYWGNSQGSYPNSTTLNNAGLTSYVVENLVPGSYFFAVTAVNTAGTESAQSGPASKTIQ